MRADRKQLVGLLTEDPRAVPQEGGQILADASVSPPAPMLGHVTSSYYSANMNRSIALALVKGGRERKGERVEILGTNGPAIVASITDPVFIDPEGTRLNV
jgi:sarcosine oxidase subunit alpha